MPLRGCRGAPQPMPVYPTAPVCAQPVFCPPVSSPCPVYGGVIVSNGPCVASAPVVFVQTSHYEDKIDDSNELRAKLVPADVKDGFHPIALEISLESKDASSFVYAGDFFSRMSSNGRANTDVSTYGGIKFQPGERIAGDQQITITKTEPNTDGMVTVRVYFKNCKFPGTEGCLEKKDVIVRTADGKSHLLKIAGETLENKAPKVVPPPDSVPLPMPRALPEKPEPPQPPPVEGRPKGPPPPEPMAKPGPVDPPKVPDAPKNPDPPRHDALPPDAKTKPDKVVPKEDWILPPEKVIPPRQLYAKPPTDWKDDFGGGVRSGVQPEAKPVPPPLSKNPAPDDRTRTESRLGLEERAADFYFLTALDQAILFNKNLLDGVKDPEQAKKNRAEEPYAQYSSCGTNPWVSSFTEEVFDQRQLDAMLRFSRIQVRLAARFADAETAASSARKFEALWERGEKFSASLPEKESDKSKTGWKRAEIIKLVEETISVLQELRADVAKSVGEFSPKEEKSRDALLGVLNSSRAVKSLKSDDKLIEQEQLEKDSITWPGECLFPTSHVVVNATLENFLQWYDGVQKAKERRAAMKDPAVKEVPVEGAPKGVTPGKAPMGGQPMERQPVEQQPELKPVLPPPILAVAPVEPTSVKLTEPLLELKQPEPAAPVAPVVPVAPVAPVAPEKPRLQQAMTPLKGSAVLMPGEDQRYFKGPSLPKPLTDDEMKTVTDYVVNLTGAELWKHNDNCQVLDFTVHTDGHYSRHGGFDSLVDAKRMRIIVHRNKGVIFWTDNAAWPGSWNSLGAMVFLEKDGKYPEADSNTREGKMTKVLDGLRGLFK